MGPSYLTNQSYTGGTRRLQRRGEGLPPLFKITLNNPFVSSYSRLTQAMRQPKGLRPEHVLEVWRCLRRSGVPARSELIVSISGQRDSALRSLCRGAASALPLATTRSVRR